MHVLFARLRGSRLAATQPACRKCLCALLHAGLLRAAAAIVGSIALLCNLMAIDVQRRRPCAAIVKLKDGTWIGPASLRLLLIVFIWEDTHIHMQAQCIA